MDSELTSAVQRAMDRAIATHGSLEAFLAWAKQRELENKFDWQGLDAETLELKYATNQSPAYQLVTPIWDFRRKALEIGDMSGQVSHATIPLYISSRDAFFAHSLYEEPDIGTFRATDAKFLRVIGNWERGTALTPPLLFLQDNKFWKWDGHHRIMIALASNAPQIPFYCNDIFNFPGISRVHEAMHEEACWQAEKR